MNKRHQISPILFSSSYFPNTVCVGVCTSVAVCFSCGNEKEIQFMSLYLAVLSAGITVLRIRGFSYLNGTTFRSPSQLQMLIPYDFTVKQQKMVKEGTIFSSF